MEGLAELLDAGGVFTWPLVAGAIVLWYALGYRAAILRPGKGGLMGRAQSIVDSASLPPGLTMRWYLDESFDGLVQQAGKGRTLVDAIVIAAPLAGLLGTVNGMIETFASLADMALFSQSGGIAGGISEALITTELGLAVAIPGLVIGRLLGRRQERIESALEQLKDRACAKEVADATVG